MAEVVKDLYGFEIKTTVQQQAVRLQADGASTRAEAAWLPFVETMQLPPEHRRKDLIRKGVPPTLRTWMWMEVSGAAAKKAAAAPSYFLNMALAGTERSPCLAQIDLDVPHTFPNHPWLREADGQAALRRVLAAYSVHNEAVGYCRSMNHIAALLLVALNRNQEVAFWLLAALVENILVPGTYSDRNLEGAQVEMKALDELITKKLPRLAAHLQAVEAEVSCVATDMFMALFANTMPAETVARVWDALFNEGAKVLFRAALGLLKEQEEQLLQIDNAGELLIAVRSGASCMHDRDRLMDVAFGIGSLPMAAIDRFRTQCSHEVEAAVRDRQELRSSASGHAHSSGPGTVDDHLSGLKVNAQLGELGAKAGVLGKQAASNLKKGFGAFMAGAKEAASKASAEISKQRGGGGGGSNRPSGTGEPAACSRVAGKAAQASVAHGMPSADEG